MGPKARLDKEGLEVQEWSHTVERAICCLEEQERGEGRGWKPEPGLRG